MRTGEVAAYAHSEAVKFLVRNRFQQGNTDPEIVLCWSAGSAVVAEFQADSSCLADVEVPATAEVYGVAGPDQSRVTSGQESSHPGVTVI